MSLPDADRPLECSECQRPASVNYTEMVGGETTYTRMCADCPVLQRRLYGQKQAAVGDESEEKGTGLCCGNCGTTLDAVRTGHPLGCSHCYDVFGDILVMELMAAQRAPREGSSSAKSSRTMPLHIGRGPGEKAEINPSVRLIALNEALHDTLRKEDYEQAAWLRDQIKAITEESTEDSDESGNE